MGEEWLDALAEALARTTPQQSQAVPRKPAAVLVLLVKTHGQFAVVLTKRTTRVEHHKGEVSFPGGAVDPADRDLLGTALRETQEELDVPAERVRVLGRLPSTRTGTDFTIAPFVGVLEEPARFTPNPREVEEVLLVPLTWLLDPANEQREPMPGDPQAVRFSYSYQGHRIWGATARILHAFLAMMSQPKLKEPAWTTQTSKQ